MSVYQASSVPKLIYVFGIADATIDAQFNAKYKLSADEVTFIKTHVRETE